ncbi:hypothetical protein BSKO_06360 [Bryopsis sp. KO-2023]|nr:hypothetical protein BSKO_06360 [Bryopsis sp. KO-2023]
MKRYVFWVVCVCVASIVHGRNSEENVTDVLAGLNLDDSEQSLQGLLNWAIENSDPEVLRQQAESFERGEMSQEELDMSRMDVKELMDMMASQPSETDLLKEALAYLKDGGLTEEEHSSVLLAIQVLVEPIDNANDLKALDGIDIIVAYLDKGESLATLAAYVLGTAASNNPKFQNDLVGSHPDVFKTLIEMTQRYSLEGASKALYALSALVGNYAELRAMFYTNGGLNALHKLLGRKNLAPALVKKSLAFLTDLLYEDQIKIQDEDLIEAVISLIDHEDLDIKEKAITLSILLNSTEGSMEIMEKMDLGEKLAGARSELQKRLSLDEEDLFVSDLIALLDVLLTDPDPTDNTPPQAPSHEEL